MLVVLALLALVPLLSPSNRFLSLAISAGINVIALYGLSVLFGQTGILSMGHAALVGVGAYAAAILARDFGVGFWLALPVAGVMAALFATIVGIPSLRVSGHHFVIMTFAFGQLLTIVLTNGGDYTGAATGLDLPRPVTLFGADLTTCTRYYLLVRRLRGAQRRGELGDHQLVLWPHAARHPREREARRLARHQCRPAQDRRLRRQRRLCRHLRRAARLFPRATSRPASSPPSPASIWR